MASWVRIAATVWVPSLLLVHLLSVWLEVRGLGARGREQVPNVACSPCALSTFGCFYISLMRRAVGS